MHYLKTPAYRSDRWLRAVASLPCVQCGREGATQAAHRNVNKGMSLKTDDCLTAALCVECHADIDQGASMTRDEGRRRMDEAIIETLARLARDGKVGPK